MGNPLQRGTRGNCPRFPPLNPALGRAIEAGVPIFEEVKAGH